MSTHIAIRQPCANRTVEFASQQLAHYLKRAGAEPRIIAGDAPALPNAFELRLVCDPNAAGLDSSRDGYTVEPTPESRAGLTLTGIRGRCVLYAAYHVLEHLGFQWVRPGEDGTRIPDTISLDRIATLRLHEQASYPFRTICIEGACSVEHILDMIDWMPKRRFNGYFIQFDLGMTFFERWYEHRKPRGGQSPYLDPKPVNRAQIQSFIERIEQAACQRDLALEKMGHGWTCAALGLPGEGWDEAEQAAIPQSKASWLAQVDGKREFWKGVPLNTNLDYANPQVRMAMVKTMLEYVRTHPHVDRLHVWLADEGNNHDEAGSDPDMLPSDHYVVLLNELDAALTEAGSDAKVVCLAYLDLLWPPMRERIVNPHRFVLMYAPITRSFAQPMSEEQDVATPMPFKLNKLRFPRSFNEGLTLLKGWQEQLPYEAFDFDYHMMWAPFFDPAQFTLARTLHGDIQALADVSLHGINSCQVQRLGFPHNLLMQVLGQTLWQQSRPFNAIVRDTFTSAFGPSGEAVAAIFDRMSTLWLPMFNSVYTKPADAGPEAAALVADEQAIAAALANLPAMSQMGEQLTALAAAHQDSGDDAQRRSWRYIEIYSQLVPELLTAFEAYLRGGSTIEADFNQLMDHLWRIEPEVHRHLDVYVACIALHKRVDETLASRRRAGPR